MARSTEQIYQHHMKTLTNGDFPAFLADYADDAVLMTMEGAHVGKDAIQAYFVNALSAMPNSKITPTGHWCTVISSSSPGPAFPTWRPSLMG